MSIGQKITMGLLSMAAICLVGVSMPVGAIKCEKGSLRAGDEVTNASDCNVAKAEGQDLTSTVTTVVNVLIAVLGIITVAVIIYGGVQMVLSQGDPGKVKAGRMAIIAGVTGLIVAVMAWAIVNVVLAAIPTDGTDSV